MLKVIPFKDSQHGDDRHKMSSDSGPQNTQTQEHRVSIKPEKVERNPLSLKV